ncbi:MAG: NUDIX hydrolase [Candidatus Binataceae bacterium]
MNEVSFNFELFRDVLRAELAPAGTAARPKAGTERSSAAVLVPLFHRENTPRVLYTRRSDRLVSHRGQVAFPGGRFDHRYDRDLLAAALREAQEEVGIEPDTVEVLGSFPAVRTHSTDIVVTPFVGMIPDLCTWTPNPREVADIFDVPIAALRDPRYRGVYRWRRLAERPAEVTGEGRNGRNSEALVSEHPAILYGEQVIWGLTYSLTLSFLAILERIRPG